MHVTTAKTILKTVECLWKKKPLVSLWFSVPAGCALACGVGNCFTCKVGARTLALCCVRTGRSSHCGGTLGSCGWVTGFSLSAASLRNGTAFLLVSPLVPALTEICLGLDAALLLLLSPFCTVPLGALCCNGIFSFAATAQVGFAAAAGALSGLLSIPNTCAEGMIFAYIPICFGRKSLSAF